MSTRTRPTAARVALLALALAAVSCSGGRAANRLGTAPAPNGAPTRLYVAIGGSETRGTGTENPLRESWPQVLFRTLPANYRLLNLGVPRATVAAALTDELPIAESLHPSLVTVWLNVNDVLSSVPPATYRADLTTLVHRLRAIGATVLLANTPPLDELPAYLACAASASADAGCPPFVPRPVPSAAQVVAAVDTYNAAIAAVAAQEGAVLVDLHKAGLAARAQGTSASMVSADKFDPGAAGAQAIAGQFSNVVPKQVK